MAYQIPKKIQMFRIGAIARHMELSLGQNCVDDGLATSLSSTNWGDPNKWMVYNGKSNKIHLYKWMIWGYPLFQETYIFGYVWHILLYGLLESAGRFF